MGKKNPGANQAHQCSNHLDHRKHPLRAPREQNDVAPCTVKRIPKRETGIGIDRGFRATACAIGAQLQANFGVSVPSVNTRAMQERSVHHDEALPISAVFRMRYPRNLMRWWGASQRVADTAAT